MKILITGASGFVGRHLVPMLQARGHDLVLLMRCDQGSTRPHHSVVYDIHSCDPLPAAATKVDAVIHLAWPGLPNYRELFHFEKNGPHAYRFLKSLVEAGVRQVLVAGTCLEYGMRNGELSEEMPANPCVPYALGKANLHANLRALQTKLPYTLQWARLFYMFGDGQSATSLFSQLDNTISRGASSFDMSPGDQLRDYLPVAEVARRLSVLVERRDLDGAFNCCSGTPVSVRTLVERHLMKVGVTLRLNLGQYPYTNYEPLAFWGSIAKTSSLFESAP